MAVDITKLIQTSQNAGFANNNVYSGTVGFNGQVVAGLNARIFVIDLDAVPDLVSVSYLGPIDTIYGSDPRPNGAWFKKGMVWSEGYDPGSATWYPVNWLIEQTISGKTAIIKLTYVQQFVATLNLNPASLAYKIIDYSVF